MSSSPRMQILREHRWKNELCVHCGEDAAPGKTLCRKHAKRESRRTARLRRRHREKGLCWCGRQPEAGLTRCAPCLRSAADRARRRKEEWEAKGICRCGQPRAAGRIYCEQHLQAKRDRMAALRARVRERLAA